jgi:hypothetical protein
VLYDVFFRGGTQAKLFEFGLCFGLGGLEEIPDLGPQWCLLLNPTIQFA